MIHVAPQMRILVVVALVDFRRGIDGLARVCREALSSDPFSGTVFVFRNRRGTSIKLLAYDGQGFWLCQKRLSEGRFRHWPQSADSVQRELLAHELSVLLAAGDPERTLAAPQWRPLPRPAAA
jgi:transposase